LYFHHQFHEIPLYKRTYTGSLPTYWTLLTHTPSLTFFACQYLPLLHFI
jgi:hypothetical protein